MAIITIILIIIIALLAGMEGILDEFQFHQPLVACTLIGLVSGHLTEGIILGGSLQMITLGWANVGAAVAPDAALASVASAIIMVLGLEGGATDVQNAISTAIAVAIPLSVAGLFLTMIVRTLSIPIVHFMDAATEDANMRKMEILRSRIRFSCYRQVNTYSIRYNRYIFSSIILRTKRKCWKRWFWRSTWRYIK